MSWRIFQPSWRLNAIQAPGMLHQRNYNIKEIYVNSCSDFTGVLSARDWQLHCSGICPQGTETWELEDLSLKVAWTVSASMHVHYVCDNWRITPWMPRLDSHAKREFLQAIPSVQLNKIRSLWCTMPVWEDVYSYI